MKLVNETLNSVHFERGKDSKQTLGLGIIPTITSDDLELVGDLLDEEEILPYEEWYEDYGEDYEDDEEAKESYDRLYQVASVLKDKIKWGGFYDHHEEEKLEDVLDRPFPKGMKYAYNAYPDADGWQVVFSSIKLPAAEEL